MNLTYKDYVWDRGALRQKDLAPAVVYDESYLRYYEQFDDTLAKRRVALLTAVMPGRGWLLDYGCGTGTFVKAAKEAGWFAFGCDVVNRDADWFLTNPDHYDWDVVTFFDSLEHLPDPAGKITSLNPATVMISVPDCHAPADEGWFMRWRHRKPGEHLYHWSRRGLDLFMYGLGYSPWLHTCIEDDIRKRDELNTPNILTAIYRRR